MQFVFHEAYNNFNAAMQIFLLAQAISLRAELMQAALLLAIEVQKQRMLFLPSVKQIRKYVRMNV